MKKIHGIDKVNTVIQKTDYDHKWGKNKNLYVCIDIFSFLDIDAKKTITKTDEEKTKIKLCQAMYW